MDGFEIVRRRAQALHRAVAKDENLPGLVLVHRCAQYANFEVVPLAPDDLLLHGAEAVLDRGVAAIFYNGTASEDVAAVLIAHELGHLALHTGPTVCGVEDLDIGTPEDPAPVGRDRIDTYGARERRELQANVFARELLLPSPSARREFQEGRTASEISDARRLPHELVLQQLSHALLVPPYPPSSKPKTTDALTLDPSQEPAAHHRGGPLLLEAGPGTGKTRTLIARIVHLIEEGVDPSSILALTFSNKAAQEISERVAGVCPGAAPLVWTGTFHAFGLEILRQNHQHLDLEPDVRVYDRSDAIELLEERLPTLGLVHYQNLYEPALVLREVLSAISRAKDELVDAEAYTALADAMVEEAGEDEKALLQAERACEVARVYQLYEQILREKKALDFGDLIFRTVHLLESHEGVRETVRRRFQHLLVDEYQDVNRASARLLRTLAGDGENLWVVGDARQSIYRFRGASAANMALFSQDFPDAQRRALEINYRSGQEVIDAYTAFSRTMTSSRHSLELDLRAWRGSLGHEPQTIAADDSEGEVAAVAANIRRLASEGVPFSQQAVLCRSNARLDAFSRGLEARGVPVLHLGSLFERDEVRDLLALLSFLTHRRGDGLMRLAARPEYQIPITDVRVLLDQARERDLYAIESLTHDDIQRRLSPEGRQGCRRLAVDLEGLDRYQGPWKVLSSWLFEKRRALADLPEARTTAEQLQRIAVYQLLVFVRHVSTVGRGWPTRRLLEKVRRLVLLAEERDLRQLPPSALHLDAVRLLTLHGSKGLEFEAIHLPGLKVGEIPASFRSQRCPPPKGLVTWYEGDGSDPERDSHDAEEECLFFVALSRARDRIFFYRSRTAGRSKRRPSKFLDRLESTPVERPGNAPELITNGQDLVPMVGPRPVRLPAQGINEYERCPRRYFYHRVFQLTGSSRDSAFARTHRVIYEVIDALRQEPNQVLEDPEVLRSHLDDAWKTSGPVGHGFEGQYRQLAEEILQNLQQSHEGLEVETAEPFDLKLDNGRLEVTPDLMAQRDGRRLLRLFKTGRKGKSFKGDDTYHGLVEAGANQEFGWGESDVEVLHLTDRGITPVALSQRKLDYRLRKGDRFLEDVARGHFPAHPNSTNCPRCPYFFVCPSLPPGELSWNEFPSAANDNASTENEDPE